MEITMQFVGGPLDGTVTFSEPKLNAKLVPEIMLASMIYDLTDRGTVGKSAMGASPAALELLATKGGEAAKKSGAGFHKYQIVERREEMGKVFVKAEAIAE